MSIMIDSQTVKLEWKPVPGALFFNIHVSPLNVYVDEGSCNNIFLGDARFFSELEYI